ncbi:hypothetical protein [Gracilibacillus saliphilus]|uniref:hypothetical protein n=1 Tax=Gracilibacillus saliphilus TaxID=543890 RepID=UPI0013D8627C|nr:hypothetical protein [Gracilibacillus saliphilus]
MKKYALIEKVTEVSELESIICNKCGTEKVLHGEDYEKDWQRDLFQSFDLRFGYGSKFDDEHWKFELCEECVTELINSFVYKPDGYRE